MRKVLVLLFLLFLLPRPVYAQEVKPSESNYQLFQQAVITPTPKVASISATPKPDKKEDITKPEAGAEKKDVLDLFKRRPASTLSPTNFIAYSIQYAVKSGVPANTIILILLMPLLATIIVFSRYIIGLTSLGLLVPIALTITLLSTGILAGLILLVTILLASLLARALLKRIRIMQLPKLAISMWVVAVSIVAVLTLCAAGGILSVKQLSIFPILLLVLLSDRVVALFLERSLRETFDITLVTLLLGVVGFLLLSWGQMRDFVLVYPETVLIFVPINLLMGRYFGLRMTEHMRFKPIKEHGRN